MRRYKTVGYILGVLLLILSVLMLIPAVVEKAMGGHDWPCFILSAFITAFFGGCFFFSQKSTRMPPLGHEQAFLLTSLSWLFAALFSALPFCFSILHLSYTDAFFEAMSGLTTTGCSVINRLQETSMGILFWRGFIQALGGIGIVVMAVAILPFLRVGGMQLFKTESSDQSEKILPRPGQMAFTVIKIYSVLTTLCAFSYIWAGMDPFHAMITAMSTVSTGGFATDDSSFGVFAKKEAILWIADIFMLLGSLPLLLYLHLWQGNIIGFFAHVQVRAFLGFVFTAIGVMTAWLWIHGTFPTLLDALRACSFHIISVVSTTGFSSTDFMAWGNFPVVLFFLLLFVGGCTGSTSGGIKIFRFQILLSVTKLHIYRMLFPHSIQTLHYGDYILDTDMVFSVVTFIVAFVSTAALSALLLSMTGLDPLTSMSSSVQALSNIGVALGPVTGPCCNFSTISDTAKWILSFTMMLGRLEVLTVLILFWRDCWRG